MNSYNRSPQPGERQKNGRNEWSGYIIPAKSRLIRLEITASALAAVLVANEAFGSTGA